ncbi:uracil-DNA glycosylase [Evansella sp. AB-rgal1]|uniref:uracil-DNA glycosylase n=1 Tax=Evansella sp. AB-rgal1 TaxID=3242696 RepID=UPI00359DDAB5
MSLSQLNERIISCAKCDRLREWCSVQEGTRKQFHGETYWARPVPGFGDHKAELLIVGLAPAAHGANRTGRVFTGDTSGNLLLEALHRHGFSNKKQSRTSEDELQLQNVYITNIVKCAPPQNKPNATEFKACREFLERELQLLTNVKVILAVGGDAFNQTKRVLRKLGADVSKMKFGHGCSYGVGAEFPRLVGTYHTSRYNIDTKRITPDMVDDVFQEINNYI